ncbi:MAG: hypothetical protein C4557_08300 [Anaerolineaceae bacterium]|jgi:hypothetical protein|nr:MAG: hypothetical protein C4557_08300 [Anaerolineaceae bacterium]
MNFQPPSKSLTSRDYQFIALAVILFLIISAALVYANRSLPKGGGDFLAHWAGARGYLFEQVDPYSGQIPARVQELVYDGAVKPGDDPYILDTPFHLLLLYFPFSLLTDPQLARAIYTLILELALFALAILSLRLTDWEAPRYFVFLFIIFCFFNFYTFQAILEASPVLLLGLIYAGILLALRAEQDELVGALLAVSMYYWEVGLPFLALVAWRSYKEGRTRVLAGFFMVSFLLLAISFLLYVNWIIPWLRAGMNNLRADFGYSIRAAFLDLFPSYGGALGWVFIGILVVALGYEMSAAHNADFRRFYWAACLSIAAAPLLGFRTEMEHLAALVIPLALVFAVIHDRWHRIRDGLVVLVLLLVLAFPWVGYFFPFISQEIIFLFLPLFTVIALYWLRWWALRPPRVWADLVARQS